MTGCVFKRKRKSGVTWCYVFFGGWDANEKRIQITKAGFPTKDAAAKAVRVAIEQYESNNGRIWRESGAQGQRVWSFTLGDVQEAGYQSKAEAEAGLQRAVARREQKRKAEKRRQAQEAAEKARPPVRGVLFVLASRARHPAVCAQDSRTLSRYGPVLECANSGSAI